MNRWLMDYDDESYGGWWDDFYGDYVWDEGKISDCDLIAVDMHDTNELTYFCEACQMRHLTDAGHAMDLLYADVLPMRPYFSFFGEIQF